MVTQMLSMIIKKIDKNMIINRKMLNGVIGALVKETLYNKNILKFMQSMFIKYKKCYFQYKIYFFFLCLISIWGTH
jgi:hypothetical protein